MPKPKNLQPGQSLNRAEELIPRIVIFLIFALALAVRLWHINWGLPEVFEEATPFTVGWKFWNWGNSGFDFNPHFFHYPAFTFYLQFLVQTAQYGIGHILGFYPNLAAFGQAYDKNPTLFILIARLTNLLFEGGTLYFSMRIARMLAGEGAAVFVLLLLALNPLHIEESHLVNVDTPLTCFVVIALYCSLNVALRPSARWYILSGLAIGLATATKYTGALLLPLLLIAHLMNSSSWKNALRSLFNRNFLLSIALACVTFAIFNPYIFLDFKNFLVDFSFEQVHMSYGHFGLNENAGTGEYYLSEFLYNSSGWILAVFVIISVFMIFRKEKKQTLLLLVFPLLYGAMIVSWKMHAERYLLPVIPVLIIIGSIGFSYCCGFICTIAEKQFSKKINRHLIATVLSLLIAVPSAVAAFGYQQSYALPDTRTAAKDWIAKNLPPNSIIAMAPLGINLQQPYYEMPIPYTFIKFERYAPFYDARWYEDLDLVVGSTFDYARYLQEPERYKEFLCYFYDSLKARYTQACEITPVANQTGPQIWLYRPKPSAGDSLFPASLMQRLDFIGSRELIDIFTGDLARVLQAKGRHAKSAQLLEKRGALDSSLTHGELASNYYDGNNFADALKENERALAFSPENPILLGLQGQTYLAMDKMNEARDDLEKSIGLGNRSVVIYVNLAVVYYKLGEKQNALDLLSEYYKTLIPGSEDAEYVNKQLEELRGLQ